MGPAGLLIALLGGYLLGSIPFGLLLARSRGIDIRGVGSGNIGATNVLRTGNKGMAVLTLLLDGGKGAVAVLAARELLGGQAAVLAGFAAFIGHVFPVWLRWHGGKGVATLLGVVLAGVWPAGLAALVVWAAAAAATRFSSVGGMLAALTAPVAAAVLGAWGWVPLLAAMAFLVVWKHSDNLARLRAGTEPKIGAG